MAITKKVKIFMLLSIFFTSVSLFLYQVILTRIYSTILSYHYVFLITSLAVFGLGIGSIISYVLRKHEKSNNKAMTWKDSIGVLSTLLSLSFITTFVMIYFLSFTNNVVIESATINWTDFLRAYTERKNDYVRNKAVKTKTYIYV
ncbi:MAG: hypothetical protein CVU95_13105 [Firmicutes bacterium HGW-Firmicutes-2]|uniref:Uncharacterized protein n=1 Tax=Petrocella atlantisensis TaxID=2173034 RepID=A0A3P7NWC9_9FIRM|nr:MAG: hypothetical protein CVU95_13105 [Firmicutes bacterium HGW-Firmicutes-2]VDN47215.1 conserved membrane protein of unknown function [Petrocella atlantisensis]